MTRYAPSKPLTPAYDPWDPLYQAKPPHYKLTSVEFTVTNMCNLRCEHCAVGETLSAKDDEQLPIELLLHRLDEAEDLHTISITGGEPMFSERNVNETILPLLQYAAKRGLRSQINSNMTMPFSRYETILPYIDVMHISMNWKTAEEFLSIVYAKTPHAVSLGQAEILFQNMLENTRKLAEAGVFVSAETMINIRTLPHLKEIHELVRELGCKRHEVHPMYASDFARDMELLSLDQLRSSIHHMLDVRDEDMWMLFGTLPFYACSERQDDHELLKRLRQAKNVSLRNDPDGRTRLNINVFTGDVIVTDFGDVAPLGNVKDNNMNDLLTKWQECDLYNTLNCYCPTAACAGPNVLVVNSYYPEINFKTRKALV